MFRTASSNAETVTISLLNVKNKPSLIIFFFEGNSYSLIPAGPPMWSSGQSSWIQIRRPGLDSRHYQKKCSGSGTGFTQPREYN
jgi:hypothetical protein